MPNYNLINSLYLKIWQTKAINIGPITLSGMESMGRKRHIHVQKFTSETVNEIENAYWSSIHFEPIGFVYHWLLEIVKTETLCAPTIQHLPNIRG